MTVSVTFGYEAPWPAADTSWLVDEFWPRLERIASDPEHRFNGEVRHRLGRICAGEPPLPDDSVAPPLRLVFRGGKLSWGIQATLSAVDVEREIRFALLLLWHPLVRGRLGACRKCGRFFLRVAGRGRRRDFCSPEHRKALHYETTSAEARAAYKRLWRNPIRAQRSPAAAASSARR